MLLDYKAMNYMSATEFIHGINNKNLVVRLDELQKEKRLDLGVCKYLAQNIRKTKKEAFSPEMLSCRVREELIIAYLSPCLPPQRKMCHHRPKYRN